MTAPIPTAPTTDLTLTMQTGQYDQVPLHRSHKGVLSANAKVAPKAKQGEINSMGITKNRDYVRP